MNKYIIYPLTGLVLLTLVGCAVPSQSGRLYSVSPPSQEPPQTQAPHQLTTRQLDQQIMQQHRQIRNTVDIINMTALEMGGMGIGRRDASGFLNNEDFARHSADMDAQYKYLERQKRELARLENLRREAARREAGSNDGGSGGGGGGGGHGGH